MASTNEKYKFIFDLVKSQKDFFSNANIALEYLAMLYKQKYSIY